MAMLWLMLSDCLTRANAAQEETEKFYTNFVAEVRKAAPQYRGALTVEQTVEEQLALLEKVTLEDTGKFLHSSGQDANLVETEPSA